MNGISYSENSDDEVCSQGQNFKKEKKEKKEEKEEWECREMRANSGVGLL